MSEEILIYRRITANAISFNGVTINGLSNTNEIGMKLPEFSVIPNAVLNKPFIEATLPILAAGEVSVQIRAEDFHLSSLFIKQWISKIKATLV
jgi:hypothetical protein